MAITHQESDSGTHSIDPERPYQNAPLAEIVERIEFAYSDGVCPDFFDLAEIIRRAELAEQLRA